jgi:uncharacterized delta-60 repeat protein
MQAQAAGAWPLVTDGPYFIGALSSGTTVMGGFNAATDSANNLYLVGSSPYITSGNYDIQLVKYNNSGVKQWEKVLYSSTSSSSDSGNAIAVDSSGNVYITGQTVITSNNQWVVAKYNSSGTLQWQKYFNNTYPPNTGQAVSVDASGNVFFCGISNPANSALSLIKYDSSGTLQWKVDLGGTSNNQYGYGMTLDSSGNIYVCGATTSFSMLLAKYNTSGTLQWQTANDGCQTAYGIAVASNGEIYTVGDKYASFVHTPVITRFTSSGIVLSQRRLDGAGVSSGSGRNMGIDSANNVYITWTSNNTALFAKYDSSLTIQWQRYLSGPNITYAGGITVNPAGVVLLSGSVDSYKGFLFARLPSDGSLTGTYTVGSFSIVYGNSSLTDTGNAFTEYSSTQGSSSSSMTENTLSLNSANTSWTNAVTTI